MTLPRTLGEIMAMGRDALHAIVRLYIPVFGLQPWEITARWVDREEAGSGEVVAGFCDPNARYQRAFIGIAWPPVGDIEETVVHELAHCFTAKLAYAAGAGEDAWALDEWEHLAEQSARGMVALRRYGERSPQVLARVFRSKVAALRRDIMDPVKLAELAMKAGEMAAREDVPEDVRGLLSEFVAALAGGSAEPDPEVPAATEDPDAAPMATEDENQMPAYARKLAAQVGDLRALIARLGPNAQPPAQPSAELVEIRRTSVETFLATKQSVLSSETERQLVDKGDIKLARWMVAEVERKQAQRGGQKPPGHNEPQRPQLTDVQRQMARRHNVSEDAYAMTVQRQTEKRKNLFTRGGR